MNNFTLIIPTHNRHQYLKRSIEYFKYLQADVIYCDSSFNKYDGELYPNVKYLHFPDKKFPEKILDALSVINTDFVALCADDDFIVIQSLHKGLSFLENNKNFKTIRGKYVSFNDVFDGHYYRMNQELPNDIDLGYEKNTEKFFQNYCQILWAMYDKEVLMRAFQIINEAKFNNDNFIELVIGACACHEGGIKFLDEIWGVRENSTQEHWGNRHAPILNMKIAELSGDYKKFRKLVDFNLSVGCADMVLNSYFNGKAKKTSFLRNTIRKMIPKRIKKLVRKSVFVKKSKPEVVLDKVVIEHLSSITLLLKQEN